jgi:hypothetical protein
MGYTSDMELRASIFLMILSMTAAASAQDRSAFVTGSLSAANMQSATDLAVAGAFGWRFNDVVSLAIETTVMPDVRSSFPTDRGNTSANGSAFTNAGGHAVLFTNAARIDIPTTSARVTPFFTAGGGVANVRRTADFTYQAVTQAPDVLSRDGVVRGSVQSRTVTQGVTASSTGLALVLGGGTDIHLARSLALEVDLRLFRLFGDDEQNLGRFGLGVRYAF